MDVADRIRQARLNKGQEFASMVVKNIHAGKVGRGLRLIPFQHGQLARLTLGPRVCRVEVNAGLGNEKLLRALSSATIPHLIPWNVTLGEPLASPNARYVAIEAAWEHWLQRCDIQLSEVDAGRDSSRFIVGPNEQGVAITLHLPDIIHLLFGGETGSGKSYTMRSAAYQLSGQSNRLIMLDGKDGQGLFVVDGLEGQVGPVVWDRQNIVNALGWCVLEMRRRLAMIREHGGLSFENWLVKDQPRRIVVLFDEFQEFRNDRAIVESLRLLATQSRATWIHLFLGTQKPVQEMWGANTTRAQFGGAIGGRVREPETSRAIMGGKYPRCEVLLPEGDAYVKAMTARGFEVNRVQVAYVSERDLKAATNYQPDLAVWPRFDESLLDCVDSTPRGRRPDPLTAEEIAVGIVAELAGRGTPWIRDRIGELPTAGGRPGNSKVDKRLRPFCQEVCELMDVVGRGVSGVGGRFALPE